MQMSQTAPVEDEAGRNQNLQEKHVFSMATFVKVNHKALFGKADFLNEKVNIFLCDSMEALRPWTQCH